MGAQGRSHEYDPSASRTYEVTSMTLLRAELTQETFSLEPLLTILGEVGVEWLAQHPTPRVQLRAGPYGDNNACKTASKAPHSIAIWPIN